VRHYDTLLAAHYSWMFGLSFEAKVAEQLQLLERLGSGFTGKLAVDLGCGSGFQSIALAKLGCSTVLAIDSCRALLDELSAQKGTLPIEPLCADMLGLKEQVAPGAAGIIVCMGDTLTHLESRAHVSRLFAQAFEALVPGGLLVLTFRDLSAELKGLDRFLSIRSDANRIMTCVLEYEPDTVVVSDLIHVREGDNWVLHKSSYRKLRLSVSEVEQELRALGFMVKSSGPAGRLHAIAATR
jgi:2-polyprenyl-3-methyl-5-hydroxy-6-metoxy-1,4-benzoquinol methylase